MSKGTASLILQVFLLSVSLGGNLINTETVTTPLPATHGSDAGSLPVGGTPELRRAYEESLAGYDAIGRRRCPLCDSSVFPYCSDKLFHDACCCTDPYKYPLPHKCREADCAFLHANSCLEHLLISDCCCSDDYRSLLKARDLPDSTAAPNTTTVKN